MGHSDDGSASTTHVIAACTSCGTRNRIPAHAGGHPRCGRCRAPLPWIVSATDADFRAIAEEARIPVLVDLWAPWCGPCRAVSPALERIAQTHAGTLKLVKVNVDESPALSQRFRVQGIPTLLLLRDGRVVERQTGAPPEPALRAWVERALAAAP
jgi:thioredoxin 2